MVNIATLLQYLYEGDYFGLLQSVYVTAFLSADILYLAIIMLLTVPIYIKTRSLLLMCILWILLGSLVIVAVPLVSGLAFFLVIFGFAGVLFKVFLRVRE